MQRRGFGRLVLAGAAALACGGARAGEPVRRRLRLALTFSNPHARMLEGQRCWHYLPAELGQSQQLLDVQVSMPFSVQQDSLGHRVLALEFGQLPPLAQKVVRITADVATSGAGAQALPERAAWLGAQRHVETGAAEIQALAAQLRAPAEWDSARAIYGWVQRNLAYAGYLADDLGALQALRTRRGDCTEYASLTVALARACGIPARVMGGYYGERDLAPQPQDYHDWAELYLDGAWRLADAQKGNWLIPHEHYVAFRIHSGTATNAVGLAHRYRLQGELQLAY